MEKSEQAQLIGQAQAFQQQMQGFMVQKESLNLQLIEINKAVEDLEKTKETEIYRISGPLLIKTKKAEAKKDLKEKQELIKTRLASIEKREKGIKEKIELLREKLTSGSETKAGAG